mgnify:CR=1 FL=1
MYFQNFPQIYYQFNIGGQLVLKVVTDVTLNVRVRKAILDEITLYDEYDIKDGDTPEIVSTKVYNNPLYHWVIMLCNDIYDYVNDWPLPSNVFEQYVTDKYGDNLYNTHHYEDSHGNVVMSDHAGAVEKTNHDYETAINESKRRIKIISPSLLSQVMSQFKDLM